jgi:alpha-glucoside transport system substrate-binding protein
MALLAYLAQPEAIEPWVRAGGFISPSRGVPLDAYPMTRARREAELLVNAPLFRYDLSDQLPPNLRDTFLPEQLAQMLLHPEEVSTILAEIERVATREQGSPTGQSAGVP